MKSSGKNYQYLALCLTFLTGCLGNSDIKPEAVAENVGVESSQEKGGAVVQVQEKNAVKAFKFEQIKGAYICRRPTPGGTARRQLNCGALHLVDIDLKNKTIGGYHIWKGVRSDKKIPYRIEGGNLIGDLSIGKFSIAFGEDIPAMELVHFTEVNDQSSTKPFFTEAKDLDDDLERRVFLHNPDTAFETIGKELYGEMAGHVEELSDISQLNGSVVELKESDVKNLNRIDLEILRHSIYARHGQSFKESRIYYFFEKQKGYVPTFTAEEVEKKLSVLEKKNIKLISRYERNARRFYKEFSR